MKYTAYNWSIGIEPIDKIMNQYEAADEIAMIVPGSATEICQAMKTKNPFKTIRIFSRHFKGLVEAHNLPMTEKCLRVIGKIYEKGDTAVKNAVETVFIFSLDLITNSCSVSERNQIMSKLPIHVFTAYYRQVYKSAF